MNWIKYLLFIATIMLLLSFTGKSCSIKIEKLLFCYFECLNQILFLFSDAYKSCRDNVCKTIDDPYCWNVKNCAGFKYINCGGVPCETNCGTVCY